jgi:glycosyltransferase involved in cell wall biosynthesis
MRPVRVVQLDARLVQYHCELFQRVREALAQKGIEYHLVYGQASPTEKTRMDEGSLEWADRVTNLWWRLGNVDLLWQPMPRKLRDADLLILVQQNRILSNYPILLARKWRAGRVAYWGHGVNLQSRKPGGLRDRWKRLFLGRVDWWFAYTSRTVQLLCDAGFPAERITCLNNAIDTRGFRDAVNTISVEALAETRQRLSVPEHGVVGLFCGSLYPEMRLELLIAASDHIHARIPGFTLIVIGDGPSRSVLEGAARDRNWMRLVGAKHGTGKALFFRLADVVLNPGLVGLHVLDAFAAGVPLVTTTNALHSPEIAYLQHGVNGLLVGDTAEVYGGAVVALLQDSRRLREMARAALASSSEFSLEEMVRRFSEGIVACLAAPKGSSGST